MNCWRALVAVVVGAILCAPVASAASGKHSPRLRLPLVPLQQAQFGPVGASLALQWFDSGSVSNNAAAFNAPGPADPKKLKKMGRVTGYLLDYGIAYSGGTGVTEIKTGVDEYRTSPDATKALPFWRKQDTYGARSFRQLGVNLTFASQKVKKIGSSRFAYLTSMSVSGADPIYTLDEQFVDKRFILDTSVTAGTKAEALRQAPLLASILDHRLRLMLAGRLSGHAASIPVFPNPGPPPGGPDLSAFVLQPSDLSPSTIVISQGYSIDTEAISSYGIDLRPAGVYGEVVEGINWYANANEATWEGTFSGDEIAAFAKLAGAGVTSVDVSAAGDNAMAAILPIGTGAGGNGSTALISLWQGQATDIVIAQSASQMTASDVQSLAQKAADRLNAGLSG
jgi:hypothetical protein